MSLVHRLARAIGLADRPSAKAVFLQRDDCQLFEIARGLDILEAHFPLPLAGEIVVIKGNIDVLGLPTTAASRTFSPPAAQGFAPLVRQLVDAGALPMGHANLSEFAFSGLGLNPHFGTPLNVLDNDLAPGGSSSGCATAIALGIADMAIGTDTSGSTRVPAAYQGIVGFRPSIGRYESAGIVPLAPSLDTPGPMARDMSRLSLLDDVLSKVPKHRKPASASRFVVPSPDDLGPIEPAIANMLEQTILVLRHAGLTVEVRSVATLSAVRDLFQRHGTLVAVEAIQALSPFTAPDNQNLDPNIRVRLNAARHISAQDADIIVSSRVGLQQQLVHDLGNDLLLMPTVPAPPPRLDQILADSEAFAHHNARALSLTMLGAYLDMPSLSLPVESGVPGHSVTIAGLNGLDDQVLSAGHQLEQLILNSQSERLICPPPLCH